ncbi:TSUP family transporter [Thalassotalea crassostreae]|uniref:TSUP family transporter n=1 Tax=Thalassotalea crassostreae TaxID=1763536 RepID=UPI000839282A|nr:TSUP family transporter [Thalassotalea crassostreae]
MDLSSIAIDLVALLFFVAVLAGFIDTVAGGGGLMTIPALILTGMPPIAALATNKLQGSMGTATATFLMFRRRRVSFIEMKPFMFTAFAGSVIGTIAVQFINTDVLQFIIPLILVVIAVYFLVSPFIKVKANKLLLSDSKYKNIVVPVVGIYDGMFGPATGSFFSMSGVACKGYDLIEATARAKPLNFSTNIASLIVFIISGHVVWVYGFVMMIGQAIGAWVGAHMLFKVNPVYLRALVVLMCLAMLIKYTN